MTKILVVFYSMTGNVAKLARAIEEGAKEVGAEVRLRQVQELILEEKMSDDIKKVKEELKNIPTATNKDLEWADGIAFGTPTRYGNMSSQLKQFIDQKSSYKIRAQKEIYKKRIDSNLKGIYHDLGALKFKDRKSHDDLARRVDHYYEVNPEKVK